MGENVKHTPGPWTVDGPSHNQIVWSSPENRVCFLAHSNGANPDRDFANGRLIAAAPELLDALANLVACHDEFDASAGNMEEAYYKLAKYAYPHWKAARAAIAKAEGRP